MSKGEPCKTCGGRGFIELDKIGQLIQPCWDCEKGIAKARELGFPEDVIKERTEKLEVVSVSGGIPEGVTIPESTTTTTEGVPIDSTNRTGQIDSPAGSRPARKSTKRKKSKASKGTRKDTN